MKLYNKFIGKKSQTAMEFLMTYGWAILIVLIVLAVLFAFGVFNPSTPNTCQVDLPFVCKDAVADENSIIIKIAKTGGIASAIVTNMEVNSQNCNPFSINLDKMEDYFGCIITLDKGDKFTARFTLDYTGKSGGLSHTITGESSGKVENLRKSKILVIEEQSGYNSWRNKLTTLGYEVILDTGVTTKAQVDNYDPDIVACLKSFWGCSKTALYKDLYDNGYSVFTQGNDNANVLYPIISSVVTSKYIPTIYPDNTVNHPLTIGWTSASGSGGDSRNGITAIRNGAYSIAKDITNNYYEGIYLEELGKGKWYHHQASGLPPDKLLKNVISILSLN